MPPHTTLFIKKNLIDEIGLYDEKFKISSDYDFLIRLMKNEKLNLFYLNNFTIKMKTGGISNKNLINIILKMKEDMNIMKKYNLPPFKTIIYKNFSKISQFFKIRFGNFFRFKFINPKLTIQSVYLNESSL